MMYYLYYMTIRDEPFTSISLLALVGVRRTGQEGAPAAARDALLHLESRSDAILVHFDVDVMDFPAADVPHANGLDLESTFAALRVFVTAPTCLGVVVTEFNPEQDPDGSHAERLVDSLVEALGARKEQAA